MSTQTISKHRSTTTIATTKKTKHQRMQHNRQSYTRAKHQTNKRIKETSMIITNHMNNTHEQKETIML